jgi:hypothetical protein
LAGVIENGSFKQFFRAFIVAWKSATLVQIGSSRQKQPDYLYLEIAVLRRSVKDRALAPQSVCLHKSWHIHVGAPVQQERCDFRLSELGSHILIQEVSYTIDLATNRGHDTGFIVARDPAASCSSLIDALRATGSRM